MSVNFSYIMIPRKMCLVRCKKEHTLVGVYHGRYISNDTMILATHIGLWVEHKRSTLWIETWALNKQYHDPPGGVLIYRRKY